MRGPRRYERVVAIRVDEEVHERIRRAAKRLNQRPGVLLRQIVESALLPAWERQ